MALFAAEGLTLIDVDALMTWHIAIGALTIPPVLLKVGSTGWRMVGYYLGNERYRSAGPPPLVLRVAGPFVVLTTIVLLGSGVLQILIGQTNSRMAVFTVFGFHIDWIDIHQASFWAWLVVTGIHVVGRLVPGFFIIRDAVAEPRRVPGLSMRITALTTATAIGVALAVLLVHLDTSWAGHIQNVRRRPGS